MTPVLRPPQTLDVTPDIEAFPVYDVRDLVLERGQAHLLLDGQVYTLRITRAGKLILTK